MNKCGNMTFRRATAFSLAVHVALFGTALAFARYGGTVRPSELRYLTVSLEGPGERLVRGAVPERQQAPPMLEPSVVEKPAETSEETREPSPVPEVEWKAAEKEEREGAKTDAEAGSATFGYSPADWVLLRSALERAKTYPRFARERGIEGTVLLRFRVLPTGRIEQVDVVRSSGARILDDASVRTIYRAAPVPYVEGWIEVPMVYQLQRAEVP